MEPLLPILRLRTTLVGAVSPLAEATSFSADALLGAFFFCCGFRASTGNIRTGRFIAQGRPPHGRRQGRPPYGRAAQGIPPPGATGTIRGWGSRRMGSRTIVLQNSIRGWSPRCYFFVRCGFRVTTGGRRCRTGSSTKVMITQGRPPHGGTQGSPPLGATTRRRSYVVLWRSNR